MSCFTSHFLRFANTHRFDRILYYSELRQKFIEIHTVKHFNLVFLTKFLELGIIICLLSSCSQNYSGNY